MKKIVINAPSEFTFNDEPSDAQLQEARNLLGMTQLLAEDKILAQYSGFSRGEVARIEGGNEQRPKKANFGERVVEDSDIGLSVVEISYRQMMARTYFDMGIVFCGRGRVVRVPKDVLKPSDEVFP